MFSLSNLQLKIVIVNFVQNFTASKHTVFGYSRQNFLQISSILLCAQNFHSYTAFFQENVLRKKGSGSTLPASNFCYFTSHSISSLKRSGDWYSDAFCCSMTSRTPELYIHQQRRDTLAPRNCRLLEQKINQMADENRCQRTCTLRCTPIGECIVL